MYGRFTLRDKGRTVANEKILKRFLFFFLLYEIILDIELDLYRKINLKLTNEVKSKYDLYCFFFLNKIEYVFQCINKNIPSENFLTCQIALFIVKKHSFPRSNQSNLKHPQDTCIDFLIL